ncbi:MAG: GYF domain-containing protein, partial [Myxococcota bacterium]|nr:GYF domain-containing protein [Myxococcota bacterium]
PSVSPGAATSAARASAPARSDAPASALAGAFRTSVHRDEEVSAPIDMSELSPSDEWYVAINGVPVGPILVAEMRRKAALGALTEESLVWQEGLDEWRPLRSFPDLAASVREVMGGGRSSMLPPAGGEGRGSTPPPHRVTSARPVQPSTSSGRASPPTRPPARTNVVPFVARAATAAKLEEHLDEAAGAAPVAPSAAAALTAGEPFPANASPASAKTGRLSQLPVDEPGEVSAAPASLPPVEGLTKKGLPWMAIAMVAAAVAFGVTAAVAVFFRPTATPTLVAAPPVQIPSAAPTAAPSQGALRAVEPTEQPAIAPPSGPPIGQKGAAASKGGAAAAASNTSPNPGGRSLDLHALTQNGPTVAPTDDPAGEGPKAAGQCFSEGQVQQVIGMHQTAIRRACWERNPTTKLTVNVTVGLTIGTDGSAQSVAANGDETSVAKCIENDVRLWRFPQMGCTQKTSFSLKFVRQ